MICEKCGNTQGGSDKFCAKCGTAFTIEKQQSAGESRTIVKRKGPVKIIKISGILKEINKSWFLKVGAGLMFFLLCGTIVLFIGESLKDKMIGLITVLITILLGLFIYKQFYVEKKYIPKKSFYTSRLDKRQLKKLILICMVLIVIIGIIWSICSSSWQGVICTITTLPVLIYSMVSIKVHEDVDYSTSQMLEDIIGMEIDERILASYQNFDSTKKIVNNNNLIIVTNRKIFYAKFINGKWIKLIRYFDELQGFGFTSKGYYTQYLKLVFTDKTSLILKLDLLDKITSNPNLFFKRFLFALDLSILGETAEFSRRRRITVSEGKKSYVQTERIKVDESSTTSLKRQIEFSTETLEGLSKAEEYTSSRALEL